MNRQRRSDESFEDYRADMKQEQADINLHLKGRMFHVSKTFTWIPDIMKMNGGKFIPNLGVTYVRPT